MDKLLYYSQHKNHSSYSNGAISIEYINKLENLQHSPLALAYTKEGSMLPLGIDHSLSDNQKKKWLYCQDPYFRQGYYTILQLLDFQLIDFFNNYTFLFIKPEAIAKRAILPIIEALKINEFDVVFHKTLKLSRHERRLLWYYHLNRSPLERFPLIDLLFENKDSILLFVKDKKAKKDSFACKRLSSIKGSVMEEKRKRDQLRSMIGAGSGLLSYIHTPDEPLDIIRELSIFFSETDMSQLIQYILQSNTNFSDIYIKELYASNIAHDLHYDSSKQNLYNLIKRHVIDTDEQTKILRFLGQLNGDNHDKWLKILVLLKYKLTTQDIWDIITIGARHTAGDISGMSYLDQE